MKIDNPSKVLTCLFTQLDVPFTNQIIRDELQKHRTTGGLSAIRDLLFKWEVPNTAYELKFEQLFNLSMPFIACFSNNKFALVTQLDKQNATVSNEKWNNEILNLKEFKHAYRGTVLITERCTKLISRTKV